MAGTLFRRSRPLVRQVDNLLVRQSHVFAAETLASVQAASSPVRLSESIEQEKCSPRWSGAALFAGVAVLGLAQQVTFPREIHADASVPDSELDDLAVYRRAKQKTGLPKEIILYQYEACPFCNKVKAFLDYHNVPYRAVEVNPLTKKQIKWSGYKKVPIIMLDLEIINDSSIILSRLACEFEDEPQSTPKKSWFSRAEKEVSRASEVPEAEELKWRLWVDKKFVQALTVNIYKSPHEAWQTFDYITSHGNFNFFERQAARVAGSGLMYAMSGRLIKKYGIVGDLRQNLYELANEWAAAVGEKKFMGGNSPNLADLSMFGVIRAVTGTDSFQDLMHKTELAGWYERMMAAVGSSSRLPEK